MNKAQKITVAITAILIALIFLFWWSIYYVVDDMKHLLLFVVFLGAGIYFLLGLKKKGGK